MRYNTDGFLPERKAAEPMTAHFPGKGYAAFRSLNALPLGIAIERSCICRAVFSINSYNPRLLCYNNLWCFIFRSCLLPVFIRTALLMKH